jgi:hypothetical protein
VRPNSTADGEPRPGDDRTEDDRLGEDPRDQELVVVAALDCDRTAEDVDEQQDEHDGLKRGEDKQVRDALDLDEVALGHDETVADGTYVTHRDTS